MKYWFVILGICFFGICCTNKIKAEEAEKNIETNSKITLQITEVIWSGWVEGGIYDVKTEIREIAQGDIIKLFSAIFKDEAVITIKDIKNDRVIVHFNTKYIVKTNPDRGLDLKSDKYNWTDEIKYNEEYKISTQTMDEGVTWELIFSN